MAVAPESSGISLSPAPKIYRKELDKAREPSETVAWVRERFAPLGDSLLKETKRIDTGRLDIPVFLSICGEQATMLTSTKKQMGKGASPIQSEASALMELAERVSFFNFIKNTEFPWAVAPQAPGPQVPFAQAAKAVHHPGEDLARAQKVYDLLPQQWAWARELASGAEELIPLSWFYAINEYNGPAAGNCLEEAVLQALCEVVERHISAVVTLEKRPTPAIAKDSIGDPVSLELIAKLEKAGIEVFLKDFTCDMGMPSVAALCWDPSTFPQKSEIVYAAGTATSPSMALVRALTEVAQLAGDFHTGSNYKVSALPKFVSMEEAAYVTQAAGTLNLSDLPDLSRPDFQDEVEACAAALKERGFSTYLLNVTHPVLQVPAVYCIVPGAHFAYRTSGTDVIFHAAKLASQLPNPGEAAQVLSEMAEAAGDSYRLRFFQGLALARLELAEPALAAFEQALTLSPAAEDLPAIHTHRGAALKDLGRIEEAKAALELAADTPEPHPEVFNLLGYCHFASREYEQAMEVFSRAIELDPALAINYANIGSCLRELGEIEKACQMYRHALEIDPGIGFARDNLARLGCQG